MIKVLNLDELNFFLHLMASFTIATLQKTRFFCFFLVKYRVSCYFGLYMYPLSQILKRSKEARVNLINL